MHLSFDSVIYPVQILHRWDILWVYASGSLITHFWETFLQMLHLQSKDWLYQGVSKTHWLYQSEKMINLWFLRSISPVDIWRQLYLQDASRRHQGIQTWWRDTVKCKMFIPPKDSAIWTFVQVSNWVTSGYLMCPPVTTRWPVVATIHHQGHPPCKDATIHYRPHFLMYWNT